MFLRLWRTCVQKYEAAERGEQTVNRIGERAEVAAVIAIN